MLGGFNEMKKLLFFFVPILLFILKISTLVAAAYIFFSFLLFYILDTRYKINFGFWHYLILTVIFVLGAGISGVYFIFPHYDKILHLTMPFFGGILIFYSSGKIIKNFGARLLFTFSLLLSFLVILELGEYYLDLFFKMNLQGVFLLNKVNPSDLTNLQGGLQDTMVDLSLGLLSGLIFIGYKFIERFTKLRLQKRDKNRRLPSRR